MKNIKIAAQLYTVRELLKDKSEKEIFSVLRQIKDIGYNYVQISGVGDITPQLAKIYMNVCTELDLGICATHLSIEFLKNNFDWVVKYHKMWNCEYVGIGAMPNEYRSFDKVDDFINDCNKYGKMLKRHDLTLIYHNHKFEFEKQDEKTMLDILFDNLTDDVEFEVDTYWVQAGGANPIELIRKANGRMSVVHFKDYRIVNDEVQFAEVGNGNLNWNGIIKACEEIQVIYAAIEQDSFTDDPIMSLKISFDYLKNLL